MQNYVHTKRPIEDAVNLLVLHGYTREAIVTLLTVELKILLGNTGVLLIDEEGDGTLSGIVIGNDLLIEHAADLSANNDWETTFVPKTEKEELL